MAPELDDNLSQNTMESNNVKKDEKKLLTLNNQNINKKQNYDWLNLNINNNNSKSYIASNSINNSQIVIFFNFFKLVKKRI